MPLSAESSYPENDIENILSAIDMQKFSMPFEMAVLAESDSPAEAIDVELNNISTARTTAITGFMLRSSV